MAKVQQFKNKPEPFAYGQYYYDNDIDDFQPVEESDGVKKPFDKFSKQTLYSTVVSDETRDTIVENKLRFIGDSRIVINNLQVREDSTSDKHIDVNYRGYICDKNTFDCFEDSTDEAELKDYNVLHDFFLFSGGEGYIVDADGEGKSYMEWMNYHPGNISDNGKPEFDFLFGKSIIKKLDNSLSLEGGDYLEPENRNIILGLDNMNRAGDRNWDADDDVALTPFKPNDNITNPSQRLTSIFQENGLGGSAENYIQIVLWLKSNKSGRSRDRRFYVFKISPSQILNTTPTPAEPGPQSGIPIVFDNFPSVRGHRTRSDTDKPAWKVTNFSITITVNPGISIDESPHPKDLAVLVEPAFPLLDNNLDIDFTNYNVLKEPFTTAVNGSTANLFRKNFNIFPIINLLNNTNQNLQMFKTNELDRQICSSPTTVELKINPARYFLDDMILTREYPSTVPPYYKFCVVHWNDINDEFETVSDVFDKKPLNFDDVLDVQENNTFIFKDVGGVLYNDYKTPGIKKIKIFVFNYVKYNDVNWSTDYKNSEIPPFHKIEPLRFKLITTRIYLDIPISEYPDFGEVGGADYTTIPWPFTTPIIGGVSENSKYLKSVNDISSGGKVGDTDIIDETFLLEAKENDELGKGIEKLNLEQCRYFDKPYGMNKLLLIPTSMGKIKWGDFEAAKQSIISITDGANSVVYNLVNEQAWAGSLQTIDLTDSDKVYSINYKQSDSPNTFYDELLLPEEQLLIVDDAFQTFPLIKFGSAFSIGDRDLGGEGYRASKFLSSDNFTPDLNSISEDDIIDDGNIAITVETRYSGQCGYYPDFGWFGDFYDNDISLESLKTDLKIVGEAYINQFSSNLEYISIINNTTIPISFYPNGLDFEYVYYTKINYAPFDEDNKRIEQLKITNSPVTIESGERVYFYVPHQVYSDSNIQFYYESIRPELLFQLPYFGSLIENNYTDISGSTTFNTSSGYWNGIQNKFSDESSVGQIFITDNLDLNLVDSCKFEFNTGDVLDKSIYDSSGNVNKGLLIGDYKLKKRAKGEPMTRDSFIKVPKKNNEDGAL